ncbi:MAG: polyprenol monophosphomannose synthase [Armatimonadetes bacterium]|nr:polyprenol monophosphomannose synthase [Armatimonadota bacterium]
MRGIVVVPTYNERDNIVQLIEAVMKIPIELDMLIVDDNSPDCTADLVEQISLTNARVHLMRRTGNRGFGPSYVDGFKWALAKGYDAIFSMDADFSHDPESLPSLAKALEEHDMVLGSRYFEGRVSVVNWPLFRLFLSVFAGRYVRLITGLKVGDPTTGFRGFRRHVLESINLDTIKSNGYSFLVETLYRAYKCGFDIAEVPIIFTERREGSSKMSRKIMFEAALMPWRLRFGRFRPPKSCKP